MVKHLHLISGLPRSGSTLLCALLRQNPRYTAAMTSPVAMLCGAMHQKMCDPEFGTFFDDEKRARMLRGVFDSYYADSPSDQVVFDTNRTWTGRLPLLGELYPQSRVICCVRDVAWIIDSIEQMLAKNPLQLSRIFRLQPGASVYARSDVLMNPDNGLIGLAWSNLREAWFGNDAKRLIVVPYEHLSREPGRTMQRLYEALGEPDFPHDFDNVVYDEPDYDALLGMPGMHKVRAKVAHHDRAPCIPPDLYTKVSGANFWLKREMNPRGVVIV
ncbi:MULTISPECIES: sulfotransferase [Paraburkholderia]|uniref:sulfotransferase family protein n=1 Tax=Paraburkholderia TaxID=1822464 RepID=UPI002254F8A5|nr:MULTISPECIES: sulfotransferase [Paraburkholderia]MCX4161240.1 sulfotransferase [Paraburkholderia megapolitana]MDN7156736.1 sulfotransferase [Paraburkholderia sp. CHISQ3]MDQ6493781.1 sulfotransferase [Paraburkholderia megapolitana]